MKTLICHITNVSLGIAVIFFQAGRLNPNKVQAEKDYHHRSLIMKDTAYNYEDKIKKIAEEIEALNSQYPQLIDFDSSENLDLQNLVITYKYKTRPPKSTAGWRGGVPEPGKRGIWFHINFHDSDSQSQIDTQPVMPYQLCIGKKQVTFLMLEGKKTRSIFDKLFIILKRHGVVDCRF